MNFRKKQIKSEQNEQYLNQQINQKLQNQVKNKISQMKCHKIDHSAFIKPQLANDLAFNRVKYQYQEQGSQENKTFNLSLGMINDEQWAQKINKQYLNQNQELQSLQDYLKTDENKVKNQKNTNKMQQGIAATQYQSRKNQINQLFGYTGNTKTIEQNVKESQEIRQDTYNNLSMMNQVSNKENGWKKQQDYNSKNKIKQRSKTQQNFCINNETNYNNKNQVIQQSQKTTESFFKKTEEKRKKYEELVFGTSFYDQKLDKSEIQNNLNETEVFNNQKQFNNLSQTQNDSEFQCKRLERLRKLQNFDKYVKFQQQRKRGQSVNFKTDQNFYQYNKNKKTSNSFYDTSDSQGKYIFPVNVKKTLVNGKVVEILDKSTKNQYSFQVKKMMNYQNLIFNPVQENNNQIVQKLQTEVYDILQNQFNKNQNKKKLQELIENQNDKNELLNKNNWLIDLFQKTDNQQNQQQNESIDSNINQQNQENEQKQQDEEQGKDKEDKQDSEQVKAIKEICQNIKHQQQRENSIEVKNPKQEEIIKRQISINKKPNIYTCQYQNQVKIKKEKKKRKFIYFQKSKESSKEQKLKLQKNFKYMRQRIYDFIHFLKDNQIKYSEYLEISNTPNQIFFNKPYERPGSFTFFKAVNKNQQEIVLKMIHCQCRFIIFDKDHNLKTALHIALQKKYIQLAEYLIHLGSNLNAQDKDGKTPLYYAIINNLNKLAQLMLYKKALPWASKQDNLKVNLQNLTQENKMKQVIQISERLQQVMIFIKGYQKKNVYWESVKNQIMVENLKDNYITSSLSQNQSRPASQLIQNRKFNLANELYQKINYKTFQDVQSNINFNDTKQNQEIDNEQDYNDISCLNIQIPSQNIQ